MLKSTGLFLIMLLHTPVFACTTFLIDRYGELLFGRNYDWVTGTGIIHSNQRGLFKISSHEAPEPAMSWTSKYGSLTFNQYGKEFPTGGMNEKGLVVELMWLDGTRYPAADKRPALNVLQWIQYQLDNCANTQEVIGTDSKLRIAADDTPLHYLVADASGDAATIEFLDGKMVVHQGKDLPFAALTNTPYAISVGAGRQMIRQKNAATPTDNSLRRFVKACQMLTTLDTQQVKSNLKDYAFTILQNVSQGDFTKWSIVYDIKRKTISFKTADNKRIRVVQFADFDFACRTMPRMYNLEQSHEGVISHFFTNPDHTIKRRSLEKAIKESSAYVHIGEASKERLLKYEYGIKCNDR